MSAGTTVSDGHVLAERRSDALWFIFDGFREDADAGLKPTRPASSHLRLEHAVLLCEVLATGAKRGCEFVSGGRTWQLSWSLEDPRLEEEREPNLSLADQPVWFWPGGEDRTVFRMKSGSLIEGLSAELARLLADDAVPERASLNTMVVLLDQALLRCGI